MRVRRGGARGGAVITTLAEGDAERRYKIGDMALWLSSEPEHGELTLHRAEKRVIEMFQDFEGWLEQLTVYEVKEMVKSCALDLCKRPFPGGPSR
jgi:hypothetical protein